MTRAAPSPTEDHRALPVCDYEGSDYQERFWERGGRQYEDRAEVLALRALLPQGQGRLLEIGAGAGRMTPRYRGFAEIVLLDYARSQLRKAKARLGQGREGTRYRYVAGNVYTLPFPDAVFDAATMIRTIHHLVDPLRGLREVYRVLKPGGVFLLEFPNKRHIKAVLRYLLRRQAWNPFTPEPIEFAALNFDFHPAQMEAWVQEAGFRIEARRAVSYFRWPPLKRALPLAVLLALEALAQPTGRWTWSLYSPSVFLRAVKPQAGHRPAPGRSR